MPSRREVSWDLANDDVGRRPTVAGADPHPENEFEALMRCRPFEDPHTPKDELLPMRDVLQDAIEELSPREQWILDALIVRRVSHRALARELGVSKSLIGYLRDQAVTWLRLRLEHEPLIAEYLERQAA